MYYGDKVVEKMQQSNKIQADALLQLIHEPSQSDIKITEIYGTTILYMYDLVDLMCLIKKVKLSLCLTK
jgi:hypothetical protein